MPVSRMRIRLQPRGGVRRLMLADLERIDRATRNLAGCGLTVGEPDRGENRRAPGRGASVDGKINGIRRRDWPLVGLRPAHRVRGSRVHENPQAVVQFDYAQRSRMHRISVSTTGLKWVRDRSE
jgi:hypothetical protein